MTPLNSLMCGTIGGEPRELKFAVVNHEIEPGNGCDFTEGCDFANVSCRYLYALNDDPTFDLIHFGEEEYAYKVNYAIFLSFHLLWQAMGIQH